MFNKHRKTPVESIYLAFDQYPTSKGASTHIDHMIGGLSHFLPRTLLVTLNSGKSVKKSSRLVHKRLLIEETDWISRTRAYQEQVKRLLDQSHQLKIAQFRDIWGGLPVIEQPHIKSIFEVNGLPSIELPYRYPELSSGFLAKLVTLENRCLLDTDAIVCPSQTIKNHLIGRGIKGTKITVVTNGADCPETPKSYNGAKKSILYFGALQPWQGIDTLLKSVRYLKNDPKFELIICSSTKEKHSRTYRKIADRLGVSSKIKWYYQLSKPKLQKLIRKSVCTVAPLKECSRNVEQGCSPLKIFESLAQGVPVIASDLPIVREILPGGVGGYLIKPDDPGVLALAMRKLLEQKEYSQELGHKGFFHIKKNYQWNAKIREMHQIYENVLSSSL